MFSITIITGLASLFGCLCMALVCTVQMVELFAAARPAAPRPWELPAPSYGFAPFEPRLATACA
jgi:hypothetical protein